MNIVIIDGYTLNPGDLSWKNLKKLGQVSIYPRTSATEFISRAQDAAILIVNKHIIDAATFEKLPHLKCICVSATGVNNIDLQAAKKHGVTVCNVIDYSTPSVAQHVFALLLELTNKIALHNNSVHQGGWSKQEDFCYTLSSIHELSDLSLGIYGFGRIGQRVATIALAFGMTVFAHHKHPKRDAMDGVTFVDLPTLFTKSNIISLHAPLNTTNQQLVNQALLQLMPQPSFLVNTGRGGLINEEDLLYCLQNNILNAAALDVLSVEPPPKNHPLLTQKNCIITPHIAWASKASRQRLLDETVWNISAFIKGEPGNVVS